MDSLIAYAIDFVSFFVKNTKKIAMIKQVVLFGSVARGEEGRKSDVDIFVDVFGSERAIEKEAKAVLNEFYGSVKFKKYWKLLGIKNEIKSIVGKLQKWKKLKESIIANGIVLYGKYKEIPEGGKSEVLFSWENIKKESIRVALSRKIFGYKQNKKFYPGLLQKYNGERIGKETITVPVESASLFIKLFHSRKVPLRIRRIISLS